VENRENWLPTTMWLEFSSIQAPGFYFSLLYIPEKGKVDMFLKF